MTLPIKVVDINTAAWSDHRNQNHGGVQPSTLTSESDDDTTFYNLGDTAQYVGQSYSIVSADRGHKLLRLRLYLQRVGSPSGNVFVDVKRPTASDSDFPDLSATPLATSLSYPASSIPTSGKTEIIFSFPIPATISQSDLYLIPVVTISVQGNSSNYIKVYRRTNGSSLSGSQGYSGGYSVDITKQLSMKMEVSQSGAFVYAVDKTNNKYRAYKTTDNGTTWNEQSASGAPGCMTTSGLKTLQTQGGVQDLGITYIQIQQSTATIAFEKTTASLAWNGVGGLKALAAVNTGVSGNAPIGGGRRPDDTLVFIAQGATETVMGSARRRIKLVHYNGSVWSSEFDVQGSANTPDSTLPGDAVHYDLRWSIVDPNGDCHIVYSRSDSSTLQYRKFKANSTFTTVNTLNGAVASATANYPVGQGAIYYQSPDFYVAIPYVDNTSNTLKAARCKTTTTETSGNWTLTEIVAASAEVSASNPAVLMADNGQGGKLFCWRVVPTTKGLKFTNDAASNTWAAESDWKGGGQTVGGISGFYIEDGIALVYLEESTSPDELRYDRL